MKTGTKIALALGGLVVLGGIVIGVAMYMKNKNKAVEEKKKQKEIDDYVPDTLGTVTAVEAGMNLAASSSTMPKELALPKK